MISLVSAKRKLEAVCEISQLRVDNKDSDFVIQIIKRSTRFEKISLLRLQRKILVIFFESKQDADCGGFTFSKLPEPFFLQNI